MTRMRDSFANVTDIKGKPCRVGNNTWEYVDYHGNRHVRLHKTNVVTFLNTGHIVLRTGGYRSLTTKQRMNQFLPGEYSVFQKDWEWFVSHRRSSREDGVIIPFFDGMRLFNGKVEYDSVTS